MVQSNSLSFFCSQCVRKLDKQHSRLLSSIHVGCLFQEYRSNKLSFTCRFTMSITDSYRDTGRSVEAAPGAIWINKVNTNFNLKLRFTWRKSGDSLMSLICWWTVISCTPGLSPVLYQPRKSMSEKTWMIIVSISPTQSADSIWLSLSYQEQVDRFSNNGNHVFAVLGIS